MDRPRDPDPWGNRHTVAPGLGAGFERFVEAMRDLQDVAALCAPPDDVSVQAAQDVEAVTASLSRYQVAEWERFAGRLPQLPGRGHPLLLPLVIEKESDDALQGRVTFRPYHLGGNGAAHGGTLPLLFDEVIGHLVNRTTGALPARTAYLHVNFRQVTPIGVVLRVEASLDRVEGRKRFASGRLFRDDTLVSDAEGLFVALRPGQP